MERLDTFVEAKMYDSKSFKQRKGIIEMSPETFEHWHNIVMEIFRDVFVFDVQRKPDKNTLLYYGVSKHFTPIRDGQRIPLYDVFIEQRRDAEKDCVYLKVKFTKVEDRTLNDSSTASGYLKKALMALNAIGTPEALECVKEIMESRLKPVLKED